MDKQKRDQIQDTLHKMISYLLVRKPEDPIPHMIQFLEDQKGQGEKELSLDEKQELERLRKKKTEIERRESKITEDKKKKKKDDSDSEDSYGEEGDIVKDMLDNAQRKNMAKNMRLSVSADVIGKYNKKEDFKPIII